MRKSAIQLLLIICLLNLLSCRQQNVYLIKTSLGDIHFQVFPDQAPITVANFINYVELGNFVGANFYRVVRLDNQPNDSVKIEVIQGNFVDFERRLEPIAHETTEMTGILHKHGTISMARADPGSASAAFFICINDQPELDFAGRRNPDGQGFAAFGQVIKGMEVALQIQQRATNGQQLVEPIHITSIRAL